MVARHSTLFSCLVGVLLSASVIAAPPDCQRVFKKLDWIRTRYLDDPTRPEVSPSSIEQNPVFRQIPEELRNKLLSTPSNQGKWEPTQEIKQALENWAYDLIERRIRNLENATPNFRQLDFWMYDKNGSESSFAIRRYLKPDVGFFGVGHGRAGIPFHTLYPLAAGDLGILQIKIDLNKIIESYAKLPGVKSASYIFYKTCGGGVCTEDSDANAARLAMATGVPVVAAMGTLTHSTKRDASQNVIWTSGVRISKSRPRLYLPQDSAYRIFTPEGESKPITFKKMKELLFRPEAHNFIRYRESSKLRSLILGLLSSNN